jgi:hypothetical protein
MTTERRLKLDLLITEVNDNNKNNEFYQWHMVITKLLLSPQLQV